jgi:type IV pilus assembly protein PilY1
LWRFDIGARRTGDTTVTSDTTTWRGKKVFASNPGSGGVADIGRKAFFKPSVTLEIGYDMVLFGTGDREHPQNKNVIDRIYGIKVRDTDFLSTTVQTESNGPNSLSLLDVTLDQLQNTSIANSGTVNNPTVGSEAYILKQLKDLNGWYIKLNETGSEGEKILSSPLVFNKEMFITSYVPQTLANADPCQPANLGYSNTYIVSHLTGAAVHDLNTANDITATSSSSAAISTARNSITNNGINNAALGSTITSGGVSTVVNFKRADRKVTSTGGGGIASSPVFDGDSIVINQGDKIVKLDIGKGGLVKTLYWRQK